MLPARSASPMRVSTSPLRKRASRRRDAVQGGVIEQVLRHREIEIERARLEHDAEQPQRFARRAADVMAEDADAAGLDAEQPRDQREQRALSGAVQPEQRGKTRRAQR